MARGLFLAFPGHGHVNPTIGLVNELIRKGDEIIYICSEEFRSKFENTGAKFIGFDLDLSDFDLDLSDFDGKNTIDNMGERFLKIFKNILNLAIEQEGEFDYLVVDPFIKPGTKIIEKFKIKKGYSNIYNFCYEWENI